MIDVTLEAYDDTLRILKSLVDSNRGIAEVLEGPVVRPVFRRVADFMAQAHKRSDR